MALPAASASSMAFDEVMPLEPSAAGQSLWFRIRTGLTSHQMGSAFTRELSMTWSWFGVGTKTGMVGGPGTLPSAIKGLERSTDDACIVHVPGTAWLGSGH